MIRRRLDALEKSTPKPMEGFGGFHVPRWSELVMGAQTPETSTALATEWPRFVRFFRDLLRMPESPPDLPEKSPPKQ